MNRLVQLNHYGEELEGYRSFQRAMAAETDPQRKHRLCKTLRKVMATELTDRQRQMVSMYFFENRTMVEIAQELGVNKSTVSRSIKGAKRKIGLCMKYLI